MNDFIPPFAVKIGLIAAFILGTLGFLAIPIATETVQRGHRGTGMQAVFNLNTVEKQLAANKLPEVLEPLEASYDGKKASEIYENVKVLGHLPEGQFLRLMNAITQWVSPEQGCAYCHGEDGNFASEAPYQKRVSRRMIEMTQHLNADWQSHVNAEVGVTCYTCHRGKPVPANLYFSGKPDEKVSGTMGARHGQNQPSAAVAYSSLPKDSLGDYFVSDKPIRVVGNSALQNGNRASIKQTEYTYGLMMHMSESLGVNCTYCHNTRAFYNWDQSVPARVTAFNGIKMVRDLNTAYLDPLKPEYPPARLGPHGDAPKAACATCHQGAYKPLYGASMLKDYPSLAGPGVGARTGAPAQ